MSKTTVHFTGILIQINDKRIDLSYFQSKLTSNSYSDPTDKGGVIYNISFLDNFLKIEYNYGRSLPLPENVINVVTQLPETNPRNQDQYEPKQHFAILDFTTSILWLSNSRKQTLIIDFLRRNLNEPKIYAKNIYSKQTFLEKIHLIDELRFSATPNIFSTSNALSEALADEINGYGGSTATLTIKYTEGFNITNIFSRIARMVDNSESFENIVISGRDNNNLGMLFNHHSFSRKIEIRAEIDQNENYDIEDVFNSLINKLKNENS